MVTPTFFSLEILTFVLTMVVVVVDDGSMRIRPTKLTVGYWTNFRLNELLLCATFSLPFPFNLAPKPDFSPCPTHVLDMVRITLC